MQSVATSSAKRLSCVTMSRLSPAYFRVKYFCSQQMAWMSKWLVGSSSKSKWGRCSSAQTRPTRLRQPPDRDLSRAASRPFLKPSPLSRALASSSLWRDWPSPSSISSYRSHKRCIASSEASSSLCSNRSASASSARTLALACLETHC
mmetsp:Transcript_22652/g.47788  ORF Transcript_22652/g.47788 Transcript_22652/m.47788 type:complete len:148 (-) Transcript_22652:515-958(-)